MRTEDTVVLSRYILEYKLENEIKEMYICYNYRSTPELFYLLELIYINLQDGVHLLAEVLFF